MAPAPRASALRRGGALAGGVALLLAGCAGGRAGSSGETAAALSPALPLGMAADLRPTIVTVDLDAVQDCSTLAASLVPLFDSLGGLTGEEASRIDPVIIGEIGTHLEALEAKRKALGCDDATWKLDACAAMATTDSSMAKQFSAAQCNDGN